MVHDDAIREDMQNRDPNMDDELGLDRDPHTRQVHKQP